MARETAQEIDPLSGITARIFVIAVASVAVVVAFALTALNDRETTVLPLAILALAVLIFGFGFLVWAAQPYRRRVTRARYGIAYSAVLVASITESLSQLGADTDVRNDWGPIAVALVLMVSGSYRLPREIVLRTVVAAAVVAGTTLMHVSTLHASHLIVSLTVSGSLLTALGGGAAIFSASLIDGLHLERAAEAEARMHKDLRERRAAIEEFLGNDIEALRREVLPFLREVKAADALTEDDRQRAGALGRTIRNSLAFSLSIEPLERLVAGYTDDSGVAPALTDEQRTALRTLLAHLAAQPAVGREQLTLAFDRAGGRMIGAITVALTSERGGSLGLAPFVGLMHLTFSHVEVTTSSEALTISFCMTP